MTYHYLIREGKLLEAVNMVYNELNPLGKYKVVLHYPGLTIELYCNDPKVFEKVADFQGVEV